MLPMALRLQIVLLCVASWPAWTCVLAAEGPRRSLRAAPSEFSEAVQNAFFPDARQQLRGVRPEAETSPAQQEPATLRWSSLITAETVEDEVKRLANNLSADITSETRFRGGQYQDARQKLGSLAWLMGIAANYDQRVRWAETGSVLGPRLAAAAAAASEGTADAYQQVVVVHQQLVGVIRGGTVEVPEGASIVWDELVERPLLMMRMEQSLQEHLQGGLQDQETMRQQGQELQHEAELLAAAAAVLRLPGQVDAEGEDYRSFCLQLEKAALDLADAVKREEYGQAREALGSAAKACSRCHEDYRG